MAFDVLSKTSLGLANRMIVPSILMQPPRLSTADLSLSHVRASDADRVHTSPSTLFVKKKSRCMMNTQFDLALLSTY